MAPPSPDSNPGSTSGNSPIDGGFILAVGGGMVGTALLALGILIALEVMAAPLPLLASMPAQVAMIAVGLVLTALEVRYVLTWARKQTARRPPQ